MVENFPKNMIFKGFISYNKLTKKKLKTIKSF